MFCAMTAMTVKTNLSFFVIISAVTKTEQRLQLKCVQRYLPFNEKM